MSIYKKFCENNGQKQLALLIDPDRCSVEDIKKRLEIAHTSKLDYIFVGGSLITKNVFDNCIHWIKSNTDLPLIIFPGNNLQIHQEADAILFLSLISGRNPELLIGNHVITAPFIKQIGLEAISTGYMLIESGPMTSVQYMSGTFPIPHNKIDIARSTAIAGEMLGMKAIYLDAGSGAAQAVSPEMIQEVKQNINIPLIVGGGIRTAQQAVISAQAGADILVVGNVAEINPSTLIEIKKSITNL